MKRIILITAAIASIVACGPKHTISGDVQGLENDFLLFIYSSDGDSGVMQMDTVYVNDGKFAWDSPSGEAGTLMIVEPNHFIDNVTLYLAPGEYAVFDGTMTNYQLSGSRYFKDWNVFHNMSKDNDSARRDLMYSIPEEEDPDFDMAEYSAKDRALKKEWDAIAMDYIKAYPGSDLCAYLSHELSSADDFFAAEEIISDKVKQGKLKHLIEGKSLALDAEAVRQASSKNIYEGAPAPDFSLKTSTGDIFTLSEHRGEYVLLDFWGTWCHWCVEGLPTLKEMYKTYKGRLTMVSVDTGDSEKAWLEGIKEHGMDWIQVYNSRADAIDSKFAVQGFPGFYLINPEGNIVMMAFGEPAHFVEKIGELISK